MIKNFQTKNLTPYSTPDTIAARQISLLALAETAAATTIYIALTLHWGSVTLYASAILLALPALIRSEASIKTGVRWFLAFHNEHKDIRLASFTGLAILLAALVATGTVTYLSAVQWLPGKSGAAFFWSAALLGWFAVNLVLMICMASALAISAGVRSMGIDVGEAALVGTSAGTAALAIFLLPGLPLGVVLRALATRVCASAFHLWPGIESIPRNW